MINNTGSYGAETNQNNVTDVIIQGDDFALGSGTAHWGIGFGELAVSNITFDKVTINGFWTAPGGAGANEIGINLVGDAAHNNYSTVININNTQLNNMGVGLELGTFVQGVIVHNTNFQGEIGSFGILCPSSSANFDGLTVTNSQCNTGGNEISVQCAGADLLFANNILTAFTPNSQILSLDSCEPPRLNGACSTADARSSGGPRRS